MWGTRSESQNCTKREKKSVSDFSGQTTQQVTASLNEKNVIISYNVGNSTHEVEQIVLNM